MKNIIIPIAALVVGVAGGYALKSAFVTPPAEVETEDARPSVSAEPLGEVVETSDEGALAALRRDKARLEALVAELRQQLAERPAVTAEQAPPAVARHDRQPRNDRERFERFRAENPEQYAELTNGMARAGRWMRDRGRSTYAFLDSIDTSMMSEGDREIVQRHKDLLAARDELIAKMQSATDDERFELAPKMGEMMAEIGRSNGQLRETLLKQAAAELGIQGEDVGTVVSTFQEIMRATGGDFGGFGGRGGPRGGFGGRGGRGR